MKRVLIILGALLLVWSAATVATADVKRDEANIFKISSTAYYDVNHFGHGATGEKLVEGLTLAGPIEWLGYSAVLYTEDMEYIGIYQFTDTGYGAPTGRGQSKILKGKSIGTIENGTCIDIYFNDYQSCKAWGRRNIYIQLVKAKG